MERRSAQQQKRTLRARKSNALVREDKSGYALPGMERSPSLTSISQVSKLNGGFKDSAFGDNKSKPIHRWIPLIGGFSSEFVGDVFSQNSVTTNSSTGAVFHPLCGIGPAA